MICAKLWLDLHNYGIRVMIVLQELWLYIYNIKGLKVGDSYLGSILISCK